MADYKPEELLRKLKNGEELPRLLVVTGEERYYRTRISAAVQQYVFGGADEASREISVFEKDTNLNELQAAINSYPFFCGRSLILLQDEKLWNFRQESESKKKQLDRLAAILGDIPDYCTVLLTSGKIDKRTRFYKELKSRGGVCECEGIKPYSLGPWLHACAEEAGGRLTYDAVEAIMEFLAPVDTAPLQLLQQEIEKLAVYAGDRKEWTSRDVEAVFSSLPEVSGFALLNAIAERKMLRTLELLAAEKKKGTNILPLYGLVMFQLRRMLRVMEMLRSGYDQKTIAAELKISPYAVKKIAAQCRRFREEELRQALLDIAGLNIGLRRGGRGYPRLEEILVVLLG